MSAKSSTGTDAKSYDCNALHTDVNGKGKAV